MKRERCLGLMLFISLVWAGQVFSESTVKASPKVTIDEFSGKDDVYLEPIKFPVFSEGRCKENQSCSKWVEKNLSGMNRQEAADAGKLVLKNETVPGQYMMAKYGASDTRCYGAGEFNSKTGEYKKADKSTGGGWISLGNPEYTVLKLKGNEENTVTIPPGYRSTAKAHFTWTVRVEGDVPKSYQCFKPKEVSGIQMRPLFCSARHSCSIKQDFSGGQVKIQLYIKGTETITVKGADSQGWAALSPITEMTLPARDAITLRTEMTPSDPTITGSRIVTGDDFSEGKLPETITFKLMWYNDSPVVARSLGRQRNLIAMLMPITDIEEKEEEE